MTRESERCCQYKITQLLAAPLPQHAKKKIGTQSINLYLSHPFVFSREKHFLPQVQVYRDKTMAHKSMYNPKIIPSVD